MDIRQLRYFIAIAEEKKITAAARRLHMAQPPLSQQLKLMEQELGIPLVWRTGKYLELTEAGHVLYHRATAIVKLLEETLDEVKETGHGQMGKLTVGVNTLSDDRLPQLLNLFRQRFPNITYVIRQNESAQLCKLIRERAIELAIVRLPIDTLGYDVLPLQSEPYCFVTSRTDTSFIGRTSVTVDDLRELPLLLPSTEGLGVYRMILDAFSRIGHTPQLVGECSDIPTLFELVAAGFGATIVPESVLKLHKGHPVRAYEIADAQLATSSALIWLNDHFLSKAARNFIALCSEQE
ncbi:DNA-binding transcriptional LysR family regulator [Tumebacillus sp. BK434]|uniref:LysR family transcriptional regulator n=1 Tax=Tumebacillus sp. BK434 TaxID=2512169 RepID=UPI0010503CBE|nr:LysR family transcriptional regulator [Tumebacillus sp. BK434]TCP52588.1 DNA-binding transcriptional LysR family regulator [Tumebacillus sp. BK434]